MYDRDRIEVFSIDQKTMRVALRCQPLPDVTITYQFDPETNKVSVYGVSGGSQVTPYWKRRMRKRAAAILRNYFRSYFGRSSNPQSPHL